MVSELPWRSITNTSGPSWIGLCDRLREFDQHHFYRPLIRTGNHISRQSLQGTDYQEILHAPMTGYRDRRGLSNDHLLYLELGEKRFLLGKGALPRLPRRSKQRIEPAGVSVLPFCLPQSGLVI